jgi:hypothetical protein
MAVQTRTMLQNKLQGLNVDKLVSGELMMQQKPLEGDTPTLLAFLITTHFLTLELICIIT